MRNLPRKISGPYTRLLSHDAHGLRSGFAFHLQPNETTVPASTKAVPLMLPIIGFGRQSRLSTGEDDVRLAPLPVWILALCRIVGADWRLLCACDPIWSPPLALQIGDFKVTE